MQEDAIEIFVVVRVTMMAMIVRMGMIRSMYIGMAVLMMMFVMMTVIVMTIRAVFTLYTSRLFSMTVRMSVAMRTAFVSAGTMSMLVEEDKADYVNQ